MYLCKTYPDGVGIPHGFLKKFFKCRQRNALSLYLEVLKYVTLSSMSSFKRCAQFLTAT